MWQNEIQFNQSVYEADYSIKLNCCDSIVKKKKIIIIPQL